MIQELNIVTLEEMKKEKALIVMFYSKTCPHCRKTEPGLEELSESYKDQAVIGRCDIQNAETLAQRLEVQALPTILFYKDGQLVNRKTGFTHKLIIEEEIKKLLK